ncbi:MAG: TonB-dependent receptor [Saprospiraceae bacterium]
MVLLTRLGFFVLLFPLDLSAQELVDTSIQLPQFTVIESQIGASDPSVYFGSSNQTEPKLLSTNLGQAMQSEAGLTVLQYSLGGLSTLTFEGLPARYTPVKWNGLNLLSAMNGVADLSLIPGIMLDSFTFSPRTNNGLLMNNSLAGDLSIYSVPETSKGFHTKAMLGFGSFGQQNYALKLNHNSNNIGIGLKIYGHKAKNDFKFRDIKQATGPYVRMPNNESYSYGSALDLNGKLGRGQWSLNQWIQFADREIPPTITESNSIASQEDLQYRASLNYQIRLRQGIGIQFVSGYTHEEINFKNPEADRSTWQSSQSAVLFEFPMNGWQLSTGLQYQFNKGETRFYSNPKTRHLIAASAQVERSLKPALEYGASVKLDYVDQQIQSPNLDLHIRSKLSSWLLSASTQYIYLLPGLNDLYWNTLGNPDLKAESGFHLRGTAEWKSQGELKLEFVAFSRWIDNWIQWTPDAMTGLFRPSNIKSVWSRGFELGLSDEWKLGKLQVNYSLRYTFNPSTNREIYNDQPQGIKGDQLIYTPLHKLNGQLKFGFKDASLQIIDNYYGKRYIQADNSNASSLPGFHLLDLVAGYHFDIHNYGFDCVFKWNNVLNQEYHWIQYRAMPLSNFQFSLIVEI